MFAENSFTKENIDQCLRELAKEFRKKNGLKIPAEIILIGGASILINYGFREMTYDVDAIIHSTGAMTDAINIVGDRLGLPNGWLKNDFIRTDSYTSKLVQYSKYYKTFSNIVQIRTVTAEYLVAMKLMAGRQYKNDMSDIAGILIEQKKQGEMLTLDRIKKATIDLYDSYEKLPESSRIFIQTLLEKEDLEKFYKECLKMEQENRDVLIDLQKNNSKKMNENNLTEIIKIAKEKKNIKK